MNALLAAESNLDRFLGNIGQQGGMMLYNRIFLTAKSAAYHFADNPDFIGRQGEKIHDFMLVFIHALAA